MASHPNSFEEWLSLRKTGTDPDEFTSVWPTESNDFNPNSTAGYGGYTMAFAVVVGYATVDAEHRLYSCMGHFLGAAVAGLPLSATVTPIRSSRTFATRRVDVFQQQQQHQHQTAQGARKKRHIASMQLDFQIPEQATLLTYSAPPDIQYTSPDAAWTERDMRDHAGRRGVGEGFLQVVDAAMGARRRYFDLRAPQQSYAADTLHGTLPKLGQVQKHRSLTEKTACYYWRCLTRLESAGANAAALGFLLDAGMAITGPAHAGLNLGKLGPTVSLDFALRLFVNDVDASRWLTREEKTVTGGAGRTYSEARVWDESGRMIASMSQQCLLRPRPAKTTNSSSL